MTSHDFAARRFKTPIRTHIGPIDTCTVEETVAEPIVCYSHSEGTATVREGT